MGYSGYGHVFYSANFADPIAKYRGMAMVALAYMYKQGLVMPTIKNEAELYALLSGSDMGLNLLGLSFFKKKDYAKAYNLLNIQSVPKDAIVDSTFMGDVYFSIGMNYYWGLTSKEDVSFGKYYIKESARLGDKRAKKIVDATFIDFVDKNGTICGKIIAFNSGREGRLRLGEIRRDGTVYYSKGIYGGRIDNIGNFWNADDVKEGYVDIQGNIYESSFIRVHDNKRIGKVDEKGNVYDKDNVLIGNIGGFPLYYALLYFFFDNIAKVQWTDFRPDMKE